VTGFIHAKLFAESSAVDTDFTAMLTDVEPSGYSRLLTDGIVAGTLPQLDRQGRADRARQGLRV